MFNFDRILIKNLSISTKSRNRGYYNIMQWYYFDSVIALYLLFFITFVTKL